MKLEKIMLKLHLQEDCEKREIKCEFCAKRMRFEEELKHLEVCGKFILPCPNKCKEGKEIPRENLPEHLADHCSRQKIKCPFWDGGCQYMVSVI